jgi:hypothetical protein
MQKIPTSKLIWITPLFIWLSHYLAVFPHEYAHSFTAWSLGEMKNPLALDYGGPDLRNILLLWDIDENVEYHRLFTTGHNFHAALIAFAGSGIGSALLFVLCAYLLKSDRVTRRPYLYYFIFWLQLMNLGNFFDYVPIRTFSSHGDMGNMVHGLGISPWWIFVIFGYVVAYLMLQFLTGTMPRMYVQLGIESTAVRAGLMLTCLLLLFGWFGGILGPLTSTNPLSHGEIAYFLEIASFVAIPGIAWLLWPTREWLGRRLQKLRKDTI